VGFLCFWTVGIMATVVLFMSAVDVAICCLTNHAHVKVASHFVVKMMRPHSKHNVSRNSFCATALARNKIQSIPSNLFAFNSKPGIHDSGSNIVLLVRGFKNAFSRTPDIDFL
jgi:hypothetical protein